MNARHELVLTPTRRAFIKREYGLSEEDAATLLAAVGGKCPICERPFKASRVPCFDHSHDPPYLIRGPLCRRCNDLIGPLGFGDDPTTYERILSYLRNPPAGRLPGPRRRAPGAAP